MKPVTVITAKIRPDIYDMIVRGRKRFEVRSESFRDADFIRYVDPESGLEFPNPEFQAARASIYRLGPEHDFDRSCDDFVQSLAALSAAEFHELFPLPLLSIMDTGRMSTLYAAPIGERISTLPQIFQEER
jgi:hypothetical protein